MLSSWILAVVTIAQAGGTAAEWKPFTSAKGKFTVSMPAKPTEKRRVLAVSGKTVDLVAMSARKGLATYIIAYAELGGADSAAAIKMAQADLIAQSKGELKDEKEISLGDSSGKELTIDIPKKVVAGGAVQTARVYVVDGRLYEVVALIPSAKVESLAAEVDAYFDSFKPSGLKPAAEVARTPDLKKTPIANKMPKDAKPAASGVNSILAGLASLGGAKAAKPPISGAEKPNAEAAKGLGSEWKPFTSPGGTFTILLPGEPREIATKVATPAGQIDVKYYVVQRGATAVFVVAATQFPPIAAKVDPDAVLEGSKNGMVLQLAGAKVVEEKKFLFDGAAGRDLVVEIPKGGKAPIAMKLKCRILFLNGTLYQIQAIQPLEGAVMISPEEFAGFCESLKFPVKK